jgi:multiple sugar transport system substrate-binding protein
VFTHQRTARVFGLAAATALVATLAACSGDDDASTSPSASGAPGAPLTTLNFWDPYPQHDDASEWASYVQSCAPEGVTVKRTSAATADLLNNLTSAVKAGNAPDVILLDNPAVPDAASAGLLAPADEVGIDAAGFDANLAGPGTVDGTTYGVPVGANTLGLYYNADILQKAGVDPASITNWDTLNAALEKVTKAGDKGITFAGISGEEGVFQFQPWFWGAGADMADIASEQGVAAGQLVSDWIGKGYAPKSAITDNQSASWDLFLTGDYAFAENGSWFAQAAADVTDFKAVAMPLPGKDAGSAPVPTGGEFVLAPLQKNDAEAHYANASKVIACLVGAENQVKTATALGYFAANKDLRESQIASNPIWAPWAAAIEAAQGRTTELGAGYTAASAQLSTALQGALNAAGDAAAVKDAFTQAAQG